MIDLLNEIDGDMNQSEVELERLGALSADLQSYAIAIESLGAIDKTTALSLESVLEDVIDANYPVDSYTAQPSKTNYKVTLESISDSLLSISKRIIEAIVSLFRKISEFLKRIWSYFKDSEYKVADVEAKIANVKKDTLFLLQHAPVERRAHIEAAIAKATTDVDIALADDITKINTELLQAILTHSHVDKAVRILGNDVSIWMDTITARISLLEVSLHRLQTNAILEIDFNALLQQDSLVNQYQNHRLNSELISLHFCNVSYTPHQFTEAINKLYNAVVDLHSQPSTKHVTYVDLMSSDARKDLIHNAGHISHHNAVLEKRVNELDMIAHRVVPTKVQSHVISYATLARLEYRSVVHFLAIANRYATIALDITRLTLKAVLFTDNQARKARDEDPTSYT